MNIAIAFFSGCVTFVIMMIVKIPVKKFTRLLAMKIEDEEDERYVLYKRLNGIIILLTMIVAAVANYIVLRCFGLDYFKACYALKAGFIAIALHAVYEQLCEE